MGSLPSPPRPTTLPPSPEDSISNFRVYAAFGCRKQVPNANISNWIECYNPSNNTWSHVTSIPDLIDNHVMKGFAMVSLGDTIYIIGGRLCHKERAHGSEDSDDFVDMDIEVLSSVLCYNVQSNQWSQCAPLSLPRYDFACTVCDNKIYVAGGKSTLASARGVSSAEVYDSNLDIWTPLPNMDILRYKCAGVTWQGKFHVVGGFVEREDSDPGPFIVERSTAEMYHTQTKKWYLKTGMWKVDVPPNQIVMVDERLFSCGDCLNAWGHIDMYDGQYMERS
jgi:hypothetical protein